MKDCAFCTEPDINERHITNNDHCFAFLTHTPITPGHVLVCPKRCIATMDGLTSDELVSLEYLRRSIAAALRKGLNAAGFNYAWNENRLAGQSVAHLHLHVVPRTPNDAGVTDYEPRAFLYRPGSRTKSPSAELKDMSDTIKHALQ